MNRRFLYFVPGVSGVNSRMLSGRGLISRFSGAGGQLIEHGCSTSVETPACAVNPQLPPRIGCLVHAGLRPAKYSPDSQRWTDGEEGKYFVGIEDVALPPGPADLERETGLDGYPLRVADGNQWRIPLLRKWDPRRLGHVCALPQAISAKTVAGKASFVPTVKAEFAALDAMADTIFDGFVDQKQISIDQLFTRAAELLAVNYRVGAAEVDLLGLLTVDLALTALGLAIDTPGLRAHGKQLSHQGLTPRQTARPLEEAEVANG
jgi:hypothetical protein